MDCEEWRVIPGYEGLYEVSNHGRIKRIKGGRGTKAGLILKPYPTRKEYLLVDLCKEGYSHAVSVHVVVASVFIGPRPGGNYEIDHVDTNKKNNRSDNLEYVTHYEHNQRTRANGLDRPLKGQDNGRALFTNEQAMEIKELYATGKYTYFQLGVMFKVHFSTIGYIVKGKHYARTS